MTRTISINRAPVLTLGRAVAGLNAYSKGAITVDLVSRSLPAGSRGWGAKGTLDLEGIRKLAR